MFQVLSALLETLLLSCLLTVSIRAMPQIDFAGQLVVAIDEIFGAPTIDIIPHFNASNVTTENVDDIPAALLNNLTNAVNTSNITKASNLVFAHHIVGNTYNYTVETWMNDITLAASKGIDAFALNIGKDTWGPGQVANAYYAAKLLNTTFKLFISFDMTSLPCTSGNDSHAIRRYINTYASHPNQLSYNNSVFISTFAGESCKFGADTVNQGWTNTVKANITPTYFVPSFFIDPATFKNYSVMDGAFNWNSGWPTGDYDINFESDDTYLTNLGNRSYMAAVSPWFFTHYGADTFNKNFMYRGDDWLFAKRWELLISNRTQVPFAEVITWNDYGESHYVGPVEGVQPMSQAWVDGFDHRAWLDLMEYYIFAYKNGTYPTIMKDRVFTWARLYPANASAPDPIGKPKNWPWTKDYLWTVALLTAPANVTQTCGTNTATSSVPAGLSKLKLALEKDCSVQVTIERESDTVLTFCPPGFDFRTEPSSYNFNAFVAASPA